MTDTPDLGAAAREAAHAAAGTTRIETLANPNPRADYLVRIEGGLANGAIRLVLHYVPHRLILRDRAFHTYLGTLEKEWTNGPPEPERLALSMLADLNDELVPRWLQIVILAGDGHRVLVEDKQPKWDKPTLTARAGGI
ncbi:hypothetical protein KAJ83_03780 [Marivibrio halodurans]|uniref:Uncharacterized protein n=1 Tax=Marivibrio halodurans TaxID=2039722 RepID=A0A8J7RX27_9PROT|nr:hypothetical protein [Marivibrio halodurans]MBP5856115.1 hypothetical protein [Marivibrio halodurans]